MKTVPHPKHCPICNERLRKFDMVKMFVRNTVRGRKGIAIHYTRDLGHNDAKEDLALCVLGGKVTEEEVRWTKVLLQAWEAQYISCGLGDGAFYLVEERLRKKHGR